MRGWFRVGKMWQRVWSDIHSDIQCSFLLSGYFNGLQSSLFYVVMWVCPWSFWTCIIRHRLGLGSVWLDNCSILQVHTTPLTHKMQPASKKEEIEDDDEPDDWWVFLRSNGNGLAVLQWEQLTDRDQFEISLKPQRQWWPRITSVLLSITNTGMLESTRPDVPTRTWLSPTATRTPRTGESALMRWRPSRTVGLLTSKMIEPRPSRCSVPETLISF